MMTPSSSRPTISGSLSSRASGGVPTMAAMTIGELGEVRQSDDVGPDFGKPIHGPSGVTVGESCER